MPTVYFIYYACRCLSYHYSEWPKITGCKNVDNTVGVTLFTVFNNIYCRVLPQQLFGSPPTTLSASSFQQPGTTHNFWPGRRKRITQLYSGYKPKHYQFKLGSHRQQAKWLNCQRAQSFMSARQP